MIVTWKSLVIGLMTAGMLIACGTDDEDGEGDDNFNPDDPIGAATTFSFTGTEAAISFNDAEAGAQYVVMPYSVGNVDTVSGATDEAVTFTFSGAALTGGGFGLQKPVPPADILDAYSYDHNLRTLANRFDPARGLDQGSDFWSIAASVDRARAISDNSFELRFTGPRASVTDFYQQAANRRLESEAGFNLSGAPLALQADDTCPEGDAPIPDDAFEPDVATINDEVVDAGDFCLVYADAPVTITDKAAIQAAMTEIMNIYKTTVHNDTFGSANNFTFKPVITVIDVVDNADWYSDVPALQTAGLHIASMTNEVRKPMIYMPSDLTKVDAFSSLDAATAARTWMSTLAHEVHHAVSWYYRVGVGGGNLDTISVDEGIAHVFEDLFGYGDELWSGIGKDFTNTGFPEGLTPVLSTDPTGNTFRAPARFLIYYLVSRQGGVDFDDSGKPSGGGGLTFLSSLVKSSSAAGPKNLAAVYGDSAVNMLGDFYAAMALDGLGLAGTAPEFRTQAVQTGVADLSGNTDKTYGVDFNGYLDSIDKTTKYLPSSDEDLASDGLELSFYQTWPVLYTADGTDFSLTVTTDSADGAAVKVVRIK